MRLILRTIVAGPKFTLSPGRVEVDDDFGKDLIKAGCAVLDLEQS